MSGMRASTCCMTRCTTRYIPPTRWPMRCVMPATLHWASRAGRCAQGTAFPASERERLQLRGLLPPRILQMDAQVLPGPNAPVCAGASRHCRGLTLPPGVGPTDRALYGRLHLRQDLPRPRTREGGRRDARARARPLLAHLCCLLWEWCTLSGSALIALDCRCGAGRRSRSCRCNPPVSASRCQ